MQQFVSTERRQSLQGIQVLPGASGCWSILMPSSRASRQDTYWSDQSPLGAVPSLVLGPGVSSAHFPFCGLCPSFSFLHMLYSRDATWGSLYFSSLVSCQPSFLIISQTLAAPQNELSGRVKYLWGSRHLDCIWQLFSFLRQDPAL